MFTQSTPSILAAVAGMRPRFGKSHAQEFAHTVASRPSRLALLLSPAPAWRRPPRRQDWVYGGPPVIVMPPPAVVVPAPHYDPCRDGSINWGRP